MYVLIGTMGFWKSLARITLYTIHKQWFTTLPQNLILTHILILMTCNFSADATGPTFQDETDENDGWVPNTGFSSIGHLPKRPKCALINKNHIAPGICLFSLNLPSISTWHRNKSYPNGWWGKIGVLEPGNDGATINKHKWASWSFYLLSHIHTI